MVAEVEVEVEVPDSTDTLEAADLAEVAQRAQGECYPSDQLQCSVMRINN